MKRFLFVGLGNPGIQYEKTRHNAGWIALDMLIEKWSDPAFPAQWKTEKKLQAEMLRLNRGLSEIFFLKPQTYMNDSGIAVAHTLRWFFDRDVSSEENEKFPQVVIFHDDLDIEMGKYKLQFSSGPKIHNGINSVRDHLHSNAFWTARIGVDTRQGDRSIPGKAYVLQKLSAEELSSLQTTVNILAEELPYVVLQ